MGDFDFGGNNFAAIEKAKNVKSQYDALIGKMFSSGYTEDLYVQYKEIKAQLAGIDPQIINEAGINLSILDMVEQKHQEYVQKMEALREQIDYLNKNYVSILEKFILERNESIKEVIKQHKAAFASAPEDVKKMSYNNEAVFKAIADSFVKKEEPKPAKTGLEIEDLSEGLDLETDEGKEEYKKRFIVPFAKQLVERAREIFKEGKKELDENGFIRINDDRLDSVLYAETKAPQQVVDGTVNVEDIMQSLSYDMVNGNLVFTPRAFLDVKVSYLGKYSDTITEYHVYQNLVGTVILGPTTEAIISAANKVLAKEKIFIDFGIYADPQSFVVRGEVEEFKKNEIGLDKEYKFEINYNKKKRDFYEYTEKGKYVGAYLVPYFFGICKK